MISLQVEDVELPNGNVSKREIIKHPGAVAILALTDDDKIVMVEQYRKALEKTIIEIDFFHFNLKSNNSFKLSF